MRRVDAGLTAWLQQSAVDRSVGAEPLRANLRQFVPEYRPRPETQCGPPSVSAVAEPAAVNDGTQPARCLEAHDARSTARRSTGHEQQQERRPAPACCSTTAPPGSPTTGTASRGRAMSSNSGASADVPRGRCPASAASARRWISVCRWMPSGAPVATPAHDLAPVDREDGLEDRVGAQQQRKDRRHARVAVHQQHAQFGEHEAEQVGASVAEEDQAGRESSRRRSRAPRRP